MFGAGAGSSGDWRAQLQQNKPTFVSFKPAGGSGFPLANQSVPSNPFQKRVAGPRPSYDKRQPYDGPSAGSFGVAERGGPGYFKQPVASVSEQFSSADRQTFGGPRGMKMCRKCGLQFPTRDLLQQHLKESGHFGDGGTPFRENSSNAATSWRDGSSSRPPQGALQGEKALAKTLGGDGHGGAKGWGDTLQAGGFTPGGKAFHAAKHTPGPSRRPINSQGSGGQYQYPNSTDTRVFSQRPNKANPSNPKVHTDKSVANTSYVKGEVNAAAIQAAEDSTDDVMDSQLEYSDDDEDGAGSETSHVSVEDNDELDDDEPDEDSEKEMSSSAQNTLPFNTKRPGDSQSTSQKNDGSDDPFASLLEQRAPPGIASSHSLLQRMKKQTSPSSIPPVEKSTVSFAKSVSSSERPSPMPNPDKSFQFKKFNPDSTIKPQSADVSSAGEERSGPTADKPFFSKKFNSKQPTAPPKLLSDRSDPDSALSGDESPTKLPKSSGLHSDGQIIATCMDMCAASEREKRINEKDVHRLELPFPKGYQQPNWKTPVDLSSPSKTMIKQHQRSAAAHVLSVPERVRPPPVLLKTMRFIQEYIMEKDLETSPDIRFQQVATDIEVYLFVWNRMRMIAKDFIVQNYRFGGRNDRYCIECYENMVRWHIMMDHQMHDNAEYKLVHIEQNSEQLNKYLKTLNELYSDAATRLGPDGRGLLECPNEGEFRAYYILQQLDNEGQVEAYIPSLSESVLRSEPIQFALDIVASRRTSNFAKFFRLVREGTYLEACSLFRYMGFIRLLALEVIYRTCRPGKQTILYPLSDMQKLMLFDTAEDLAEFLEYYGMEVASSDGALSDTSAGNAEYCVVFDGRAILRPKKKLDTRKMHVWIEGKLSDAGLSRSDVVMGKASRGAVQYEGSPAEEQAFYRAQLLHQRQLPGASSSTSQAPLPSAAKKHPEASIPKPVGLTQTQPTPAVVEAQPAAQPAEVTMRKPSLPIMASTANVLTKSSDLVVGTSASVSVPKSSNVAFSGFQASTVPSTRAPELPAPLKPSEGLSGVNVFKFPFATSQISDTKPVVEVAKPSIPPLSDESKIDQSAPLTVAETNAPFRFLVAKQEDSSASKVPTKALSIVEPSPSSIKLSEEKKAAPVLDSIVSQSSAVPLKLDTQLSTPDAEVPLKDKVGIAKLENYSAPPNEPAIPPSRPIPLFSFDELYKPVVKSAPAESKKHQEHEAAAAAKVVETVSFTPRNYKAVSRPHIAQTIPAPAVGHVLEENIPEPPSHQQVFLDSLVSEEHVRSLMAREYQLSHIIKRRLCSRVLKSWYLIVRSKLETLRHRCTQILFNRWRRLYSTRLRNRAELRTAMIDRGDDDVAIVNSFARMGVNKASYKAVGKQSDYCKISDFEAASLETLRSVMLKSKSFNVAELIGPSLFAKQTMALRALPKAQNAKGGRGQVVTSVGTGDGDPPIRLEDGPLWPRDLFWRLACISYDPSNCRSGVGRMNAEMRFITATRALLATEACTDLFDSSVSACMTGRWDGAVGVWMDTSHVPPSTLFRRVHVSSWDVRPFQCASATLQMYSSAMILISHDMLLDCISQQRSANSKSNDFLTQIAAVLGNGIVSVPLVIVVATNRVDMPSGIQEIHLSTPSEVTGHIAKLIDLIGAAGKTYSIHGAFVCNDCIGQVPVVDSNYYRDAVALGNSCLSTVLPRLARASGPSCPMIQKLNVPKWSLFHITSALVFGEGCDVEEPVSSTMSMKDRLSYIFKSCILNVNTKIQACLLRLEAEMASDETAHPAQSPEFSTRFGCRLESTSSEGEPQVLGALLDDWSTSPTARESELFFSRFMSCFTRPLSQMSSEDANEALDCANILIYEKEHHTATYWGQLGHRQMDSDVDTLRYGLPLVLSNQASTVASSHAYISKFALPDWGNVGDDGSSSLASLLSSYTLILKRAGYKIDSDKLQTLLALISDAAETDLAHCHVAIICWFCELLVSIQQELDSSISGVEELFVHADAEVSGLRQMGVPLLMSSFLSASRSSVASRKRPWSEDPVEGIDASINEGKSARVKSRLLDYTPVYEEAVDALYNQVYSDTSNRNDIDASGDLHDVLTGEVEAARQFELSMRNILSVQLPGRWDK